MSRSEDNLRQSLIRLYRPITLWRSDSRQLDTTTDKRSRRILCSRLLLVVSVDRVTDEQNQMIETKLAEAMKLAGEKGGDLAAAVRLVWDVALMVPRPQCDG
jgi:hypothetical protein